MAWIMKQDKIGMADIVSIQLSEPTASAPGPYGLIGVCANKQLHNLGVFSTKGAAQKEMLKFGAWLRVEKGLGVFSIGLDKGGEGGEAVSGESKYAAITKTISL